jgi:chromosome partitioning protein
MSVDVPLVPQSLPHVIVFGSEKGGSGKSTLAIHVTIALLEFGQRVAVLDLDSRQRTLTNFFCRRRDWAKRAGARLRVPDHRYIERSDGALVADNERIEVARLHEAVVALQSDHDIVVIDTPPVDSFLMRLAHGMADTLITPLNDSFVDLMVLGDIDPVVFDVNGVGFYAELVRQARRQRRAADQTGFDWLVVRNRYVAAAGQPKTAFLAELASRIGFRTAEGFAERALYEAFFPRGLTVLDDLPEVTGSVAADALAGAREEVHALTASLKLPLDERRRRRAAARQAWLARLDTPIDGDVFFEELK